MGENICDGCKIGEHKCYGETYRDMDHMEMWLEKTCECVGCRENDIIKKFYNIFSREERNIIFKYYEELVEKSRG